MPGPYGEKVSALIAEGALIPFNIAPSIYLIVIALMMVVMVMLKTLQSGLL